MDVRKSYGYLGDFESFILFVKRRRIEKVTIFTGSVWGSFCSLSSSFLFMECIFCVKLVVVMLR